MGFFFFIRKVFYDSCAIILPKIEAVLVLPYCVYIADLVNGFAIRIHLCNIILIKEEGKQRNRRAGRIIAVAKYLYLLHGDGHFKAHCPHHPVIQ